MLPVSKLDYVLPEGRIATSAAEPRDSAKLMVLRRSDPNYLVHTTVAHLGEFLRAGDLMVVNASRVIPARLMGKRADTGGKVEGLFLGVEPEHPGSAVASLGPLAAIVASQLRPIAPSNAQSFRFLASGPECWRVMLKGRRMKPGVFVGLINAAGRPAGVSLKLLKRISGEAGPGPEQTQGAAASGGPESAGGPADAWLVEVYACGYEASLHKRGELPIKLLERIGTTPLPPYIRAARKRQEPMTHGAEEPDGDSGDDRGGDSGGNSHGAAKSQAADAEALAGLEQEAADRARYQTVYADGAANGSVAAPTAGLHFTDRLLEQLRQAGIERTEVVLHVGTGTFKPVECEFVEDHPMHAEWCQVGEHAAAHLEAARAAGRRRIAIGTTAARTLESFAPEELAGAPSKWTRLLITPGHRFRNLDGLMTNFHLPRSTLLAMVGAFFDEHQPGTGVDRLLAAYREAIAHDYRFYSYGDAMLILP